MSLLLAISMSLFVAGGALGLMARGEQRAAIRRERDPVRWPVRARV
jgi:hypothetical protein